MEFSAGWKPVPSVSESNPGRSLGIYNHGENCCLEDSTSHRAKHPRQSDKSVFEKKQGGKTNTDLTQLLPFELFSKKFCLNISELGLEIV